MADMVIERLTDERLEQFQEFCRHNWGAEHPLIHNAEMFDYYYREGGEINFVIALDAKTEDTEPINFISHDKIVEKVQEIHGVCGFLKTNSGPNPDVFISYILTRKDAPFGLSFKLLEKIKELTNHRSVSCNNIRKKTRGVYDFLEFTVDDMRQWYRLNESVEQFRISEIYHEIFPEVAPNALDVSEVSRAEQLEDFPFYDYYSQLPYKDLAHVDKRYFRYPWQDYRVFRLKGGAREALLIIREIAASGGGKALRVVDFIGDRGLIKETGGFLDGLLKKTGAEFLDWYEYGADAADMEQAGLTLRYYDDENIIPLYLTPLLLKNVDITVFMSDKNNFMMFRGDGDQDRPNLG